MNPGMPQYGMPSGAPYFNGWSPYGGFSQPSQGYGMSSPFGGFGGGYGMSSPFGGFGGGYGMPFQQMPMGGGKGGYSSPFGQFQTPNFAAKGGSGQPTPWQPTQSPTSNPTITAPPSQPPIRSPNMPSSGQPLTNMNQLPPGSSLPPGYQYLTNQIAPGVNTGAYFSPGAIGQIPSQSPAPNPSNQLPPSGGIPGYGGAAPGVPQPLLGGSPMQSPIPSQSNAPIPQAVPPQMTGAVSGPVPMGPRLPFNPNRFTGINSGLPGKNMLGGFR